MFNKALSITVALVSSGLAFAFYAIFLLCLVGVVYSVLLPAEQFKVAFFTFSTLGYVAYTLGRLFDQPRINANVRTMIESGKACAIYLRPFSMDTKLRFETMSFWGKAFGPVLNPFHFMRSRSDLLEGILLRLLDGRRVLKGGLQLPLIAIGHSSFWYGATRFTSSDEDWKSKFIDFAERARVVICVPYPTPGSMFELQWIIDNALARTIFVLPDSSTRISGRTYEQHWSACVNALPTLGRLGLAGKSAHIYYLPTTNSEPIAWSWSVRNLRKALRRASTA